MNQQQIYERYCELQHYVGWTAADAEIAKSLGPLAEPRFERLIEDFYAEVARHPQAAKVFAGGQEQIGRLKKSLAAWLKELFSGQYDAEYVHRRWKIGYRHVEIGLDQVYTNVALSRLRKGLLHVLSEVWTGSHEDLRRAQSVLNTLLDLDLALIEDAYQTEYTFRKQATERLALTGQVAGGIAHELRNPLNVIKTSVFYLLNARNTTPEKTAQHLERIERQVGLANDVITSLTNFAKVSMTERMPFDVPTHLQEVLSAIDRPGNIELIIECGKDVPLAVADASQIRIVLGNLIRNAIDAMPHGGSLRLRVEPLDSFVNISVQDTGTGIEPDKLSRIMEPFYSTKARGIGLGLPMAKALVEKNEGRIYIESEPGKGSVFTVRLQAVRPGSETIGATPP